MIRKIIHIDEEKCNGCGACVTACHEGAIGLVNGKAKLMRDDYCDGFGDCLPGCPKLDDVDYSEKLTQILRQNDIKSVTVLRMEVPCCGGLERAVVTALQNSGKMIPWQVVTFSVDGKILDR